MECLAESYHKLIHLNASSSSSGNAACIVLWYDKAEDTKIELIKPKSKLREDIFESKQHMPGKTTPSSVV